MSERERPEGRAGAAFLLDPTGHVATWSAAAERALGYAADEAVGRHLAAFATAEDVRRGGPELLLRAAADEGWAEAEGWWARKDGSLFWADIVLAALRDGGGALRGLACVTRDRTGREAAEERLRHSEHQLAEAERLARLGSWEWEVAADVVSWSDELYRVFGLGPRQFAGTFAAFLEHVHPDDRAAARAAVERALRDGLPFDHRHRVVRPDGDVRTLLSRGRVLVGPGGAARLVGACQDVTEATRAEEQLRASEERYRLLFDSNPHVMWVYDPATLAFLAVNDAAEACYGYARAELLALTVRDILPADELPRLDRELALPPGPLHHSGVWKHRRKDGTLRKMDTTSHALTFAGRTARVVLAVDVTERKALEEQVRQAQKMEAVGRLAGGVAHDFNNLLTIITGFAQFLLDQLPEAGPNRDMVRQIMAAGDRAAGLTRQLLAFSRKALHEPRVLDLKAVVADMDRMLRRLIGEDVLLVTSADPDLGLVHADPGQIAQVIVNLAVNARDAMPQGGRLTIEARNAALDETYARGHVDARPGAHVLLAVTDSGTGMPPEVQARVWEPFFTTKGELGTGLGLATVYGIVKQSGGHVTLYSEVGRGSTFKIYLPRVGEGAAPRKSRVGTATIPRGTETVLLVEDEDAVRALARQVLAACGYTVLEARDGVEALRVAGQHAGPIELAVSDVVMPRLGGRDLADRLVEARPGIKVLFLSGYTDDAVVRHGILEAEVAFLQKPYSPAALAQKVREVLGHAAAPP